MKTVLIAAFTLFATLAARAELPLVETFESEAEGVTPSGWSGGTVVSGGLTGAPANGYAVTDAAHGRVLSVLGTADRSVDSASGGRYQSADILVKVALPDETPTAADVADGARFAVAFDTDGRLLGWFGGDAFVSLGSTVYSADTWLRLTVLFDHGDKKVWIAVNGTVQNEDGTAYAGSGSCLVGMSVAGVSCIDDVVVRNESSTVYDKYAAVKTSGEAAVVAAEGGIVVPVNYLSKQNVAQTAAGANSKADGGVLTYAEAYQAGVEPTEAFAITAAEPSANGIVLTFPGSWPADSYEVKYGSTAACSDGTVGAESFVKADGVNKATIPLPESGVRYYKVGR